MREFNLVTYKINGEGIHCTIDLFVANVYILTLDTGTKYVDCAEEQLADVLGRILKKLFKENTTDADYMNIIDKDETES